MKILPFLLLFIWSASATKFDVSTYSNSLEFAQVVDVMATQKANGNWCFATSIRHNDEGWEHYADGWEVIDFSGMSLGYRKLHHPHVNEQPFTRSQCDIEIPKETNKVIVRAKCSKHGFDGKAMVVNLNKD